jgi:hypothetical protein
MNKEAKALTEGLTEILDIIMKRFLPYLSIGHYSHLLNIFDIMSRKFIDELLCKDNFLSELLTVLSRNRDLTLAEIVSITGKDEFIVKKAIEKLSMDCFNYTDIYDVTDEVDPENQRLRFRDFIQHCLILSKGNDGQHFYDLSLFGIILLLKIFRREKPNSIITNPNPKFEKNLQQVASFYRNDKLPIIFGKWSSLRKYLKLWSTYNFDAVLLESRAREWARPLVIDGTKEF